MSDYSLGAQNAKDIFEHFVDGQVHAGQASSATGDVIVTGLGFTPDWVIVTLTPEVTGAVYEGWSATSTTLTISKSATTAAQVSYICGNLS